MNKQNQYPEMLFEDKAPSRERIENRLADLKVRYQNLLFELNNSNILDIDKIFVHRNSKDYNFNSEKIINKINENVDIQEKVSALQKSIANRLANIEKLNDLEFNKTKYEDLKNEVERTLTQFNNINEYPVEQKIVVDNSQNIDLVISKMDSMARDLGEKITDLIMSQDETNEFKEEILLLRSQVQELLTENVEYKNKMENLIRENNSKEMELNESFKAWMRNTSKLEELESLLNIQKNTLDDYDSEKNDLINYLEGKVNQLYIENYEPEKNRKNFDNSKANDTTVNDNCIFLNENKPTQEVFPSQNKTDKQEEQKKQQQNVNTIIDSEINQKRMLILEFSNDISKMFVSLEDSLNQINLELVNCFNKKEDLDNGENLEVDFANLKDELDNIQAFDNSSLSVNSYEVMNPEDLIKVITRIKDLLMECQTFINRTEIEIRTYCSKFDLTQYPIILQEFNKYYELCSLINNLINKEINKLNHYSGLYNKDKNITLDLASYNVSSWTRVKDLINLLIDRNKTLYKLFFEITYLRDKTTDIDLDIDNQKIVEQQEEAKSVIEDYPHTLFDHSDLINIPSEEETKRESSLSHNIVKDEIFQPDIKYEDFEKLNNKPVNKKNEYGNKEKDIDEKLNDFKLEINNQISDLSERLLDQIKQIGDTYIDSNIDSKKIESKNSRYKLISNSKCDDNYELIKNLKLKVVLTELEKIKKEIDLYENQELSDILNHMS